MAGSVTDKLITLGELKVGLDTKVNASDVQDIPHGGTNATTAAAARTNLGVYSTGEVDNAISQSVAGKVECTVYTGANALASVGITASSNISIQTASVCTIGRLRHIEVAFTSNAAISSGTSILTGLNNLTQWLGINTVVMQDNSGGNAVNGVLAVNEFRSQGTLASGHSYRFSLAYILYA